MQKRLSYLVFTFFVLCSCAKVGTPPPGNPDHEHDPQDDIPPVITVVAPAPNQLYHNADTIFVQGEFTDNKKLYKGSIKITEDVYNTVVAEQFYETHVGSVIPFSFYHKTVATTATTYTIKFQIEDHGLNTVYKAMTLVIQP